MSDETVIVMADGSRWNPATTEDRLQCGNCDNLVVTPEEIASYPDGACPNCGESWTVETSKFHTRILVTAPSPAGGGTL